MRPRLDSRRKRPLRSVPRPALPGVRGNNSVVECNLAKVEVAGSTPVSRSNIRAGSLRGPALLVSHYGLTAFRVPL